MTAVLKYVLERDAIQEIGLPSGSEVLSVDERAGKVVVYVIADKENVEGLPTEAHRFYTYGTGVDFDEDADISKDMFIGTVKLGTSFVHVFHKLVLVEESTNFDTPLIKTESAPTLSYHTSQ